MSRLVQEAKFKAELKEREAARMAALEQEWRKREKESVRTLLLPTMLPYDAYLQVTTGPGFPAPIMVNVWTELLIIPLLFLGLLC
jgi:hypothetical protein